MKTRNRRKPKLKSIFNTKLLTTPEKDFVDEIVDTFLLISHA